MSVASQSMQTLLCGALYTLAGIVTSIVVARVLGPAGKGQAAVATTAPMLLALMGNLGIPSSTVYYIGQKDAQPRIFYTTLSVVSLAISALIVGVVWLLRVPAMNTVLQGLTAHILLITLMGVPLALWSNSLAAMLIGRSLIWEFNKTQIFQAAFTLALTILFVAHWRWGVLGAVLAVMLGLFARVVVSTWYVLRFLGIDLSLRWNLSRDLLVYGWQAYLGGALSILNNRLDIYLVNMLAGNYAVGIYSLGVNFAEMMYQVPEALRTVVHSKMVASTEYADRTTPKACRQTIILGTILSLLGIIFAHPIIRLLYGALFLPAAVPFMWLLPGVIALSMARLLFTDLQSRGRPILTAYASAVGLAPKVALVFLLVRDFGPSGAAVASSISYIILTTYAAKAFSRLSRVSALELVNVRKKDFEVYSEAVRAAWQTLQRRLD